MKIIPITLLVILVFTSCNKVKDKEPLHTSRTNIIESIEKVDTTISEYGINPHPKIEDYYTLDTINNQLINEKSFVLIYPTDKQLKEAKELNETDFYVWKEDNDFWMAKLKEIAKRLGIKTITVTKRKLHFISNNQQYTVDLDKKENGQLFHYNLILFTHHKKPVFTKFVQPNERLFNEYFDLKEDTSWEHQLFY